jgi:cytochrome c biogenesis protein CcmG, thiol:disulfide interchange protein DsbE
MSARPVARRGLRAAALALVLLFIALLVYGLAAKAPNNDIGRALGEGSPAPAPGFELPVLQRGSLGERLAERLESALADDRIALAELRGTPVVLNFWASWCPPCRVEAPRLERAWQRRRAEGVLMLGLDMQDVTEDARAFLDEFKISYTNVRDRSDEVARRWGVAALPETFFITARGQIVGHVIGSISEQQLAGGVRAARTGRVLGAKSGGESRSTR